MQTQVQLAVEKLHKMGACDPSIEWLRRYKSIESAWKRLNDSGWLMWLLKYTGAPIIKRAHRLMYKYILEYLTKCYPKGKKEIKQYMDGQDTNPDPLLNQLREYGYEDCDSAIHHARIAKIDMQDGYCDNALFTRLVNMITRGDDEDRHARRAVLTYIKKHLPVEAVFEQLMKRKRK